MQENNLSKVFVFVIIGLFIVVSIVPYIIGTERISNISINCAYLYDVKPNISTYITNN
jgi:hypothetical protein